MKITALSAFVVAAMTSVVAAESAKTESAERVSYTTGARRDTTAPKHTGWVELASPTPASHGREYIALEPRAFVRLRVTAAAGRPIVRSVRIDFTDGTSRAVRIDRVVDKRRPAFVELRGHQQIERLVVVSEGSRTALYTVSGELPGTGVASR